MLSAVRRWLTPPQFEDVEKTNAARGLHFLLLVILVTLISTLIFFGFFEAERVRNVVSISFFALVTVLALWRLRLGEIYGVGRLYLIVLWVIALGYSLVTRGILSPYPVVLTVIILLAGVVLRPIYSVYFAVASVVSVTVLLFISRDLPAVVEFVPADQFTLYATSNWFVYAACYMMTATLVLYSARLISGGMERLIQRDHELAERNRALEMEIAERLRIETVLRQSEAKFRTLIENAQFGVFILYDAQSSEFAYVNPSFADALGYTPDEMIDTMRLSNVLDPDETTNAFERIRRRFDGQPPVGTVTYRAIRKDGSHIYATATAVLIDYLGRPALLGTMIDMTAQRQAEAVRIDLEVERRRVEFLREFVYAMTHDLKTPLSVIVTSLYLVGVSSDPEQQKRHLDKIGEQTDLLTHMVDDMLTAARLETVPELHLATTQINALVERVRDQLASKAQHRNLTLNLVLAADLPAFPADADQLYHALVNVVENALNYTPAGGRVDVRTLGGADQITVEVTDTGIGIKEDDLPHVFDRFYRAENAQSARRGTGLGLAIMKRIVELHGGHVTVESIVGTGSTFRLFFPINAATD